MRISPPYVSFPAWLRCVEQLGPQAPGILGRDSFPGPASTANQMLQAFRSLRLMTAEGKVSSDLKKLIEHSENRPPILAKVLRQAYPEILSVGDDRIRTAQVEAVVARTGLNAATQRKAVMFLLNAAEYAGLVLDASETPESRLKDAPQGSRSNRNRIELRSGGFIEISFDVDLFRAKKEDRELLIDLIDRLRAYEIQHQTGEDEEDRYERQDEAPF